ncbi:serum response factor-binding protein 1 isoform X2 [Scyliorhinus canicula]|uniref:serum response factor-binding protein 1 isoform X2 n=1 Tax=Scyliorhinus canicula TaxID=7830 RepID=UPI0018F33E8F|nr:serum response factor-binding protein 1 isoform X2 [Scyliorhinus canicula]
MAAVEPPVNLNNEVVKLRKDVKKARTLIIRKLTRNITQLKAKKGTKDAILKNLRRAERLLEEIHTMKPNSTAVERAVARIASHPLMSRKIAAIKAAVNSFKEARQKTKGQRFHNMVNLQTRSLQQASPEEISSAKKNEIKEDDTADEKAKIEAIKQTSATISECETEALHEDTASITEAAEVTQSHQDIEENTCTLSKTQKELNVSIKSENIKPIEAGASDLNVSSEEEKEYFDDSTEERFYNQTSSDDSGDDDFFIGKVKRINKKKQEFDPTTNTVKEDKSMPSKMKEEKNDPMDYGGKKNRTKTRFGSLFCNNLSGSKASKQKSNFQRDIKNKKSDVIQNKSLSFRGRSCGRPGVVIPKPQQSLHPSWEASRKRKEQTQILAFQGKKIRFDD